ncbi:hypothetical protein CEUSTIGMA_g11860.t1 [Chlamydomonas eustigma]|uniref:Isopenicillin N synthase-like Fe(2+) 2OG dioxygenase domain-containing protein n=1 Tax=Chlamydomonas eustigma TaxID=1157962 RepID=A0A250XNR7_9CHLO|nr:hypothetical protein CEUSTIGMA_g11860.t1 [Chlamydomonas eustigma]|eukprot:GAX84440.1 hypothetical protein CEUSTIGMA_g11860.t1 [Chlamydomonas eustigma]
MPGDLSIVDLSEHIEELETGALMPSTVLIEMCRKLAHSLMETGCVIVRDPRVEMRDNDIFLNMMETYFSQPISSKMQDVRPDLHFQVGATPGGQETPKILVDKLMQQSAACLKEGNRATLPTGPDPKWRFFWRIGERPKDEQFTELNAEPVIPAGFPEWQQVMDSWGGRLVCVAETLSKALAVGLGLQVNSISNLMQQGPHLLAPTGSDLGCPEGSKPGYVFAGYHYDLNLLTLHGRCRFPGLYVWLRDGRRVAVRVPAGCLIVQAGKQLEWLTGGAIVAGMHEVVVNEDTIKGVLEAKAAGRPLWRVSSTVFTHVASSKTLMPLDRFATSSSLLLYPPTLAGVQVQQELEALKLKKKSSMTQCCLEGKEQERAVVQVVQQQGGVVGSCIGAGEPQETDHCHTTAQLDELNSGVQIKSRVEEYSGHVECHEAVCSVRRKVYNGIKTYGFTSGDKPGYVQSCGQVG